MEKMDLIEGETGQRGKLVIAETNSSHEFEEIEFVAPEKQ